MTTKEKEEEANTPPKVFEVDFSWLDKIGTTATFQAKDAEEAESIIEKQFGMAPGFEISEIRESDMETLERLLAEQSENLPSSHKTLIN